MRKLIATALKSVLFILQLAIFNLIIKICYGWGAGCWFRYDRDTFTFDVDFIHKGNQHRYTLTLFKDTDCMSIHHGTKNNPYQDYISEDVELDVGIQLIKEDLQERGIIRKD